MTKTVTVQKGEFVLTVPRSDLIELVETPDGVCFNFKGGLTLQVMDADMPIYTKNVMKNTADNFPNGHLNVNLNDRNKPASIDTT